MKLLIVVLLNAAVVFAKPTVDSRVSSGVTGTAGIVKCYVHLLLTFDTSGTKPCGGCVIGGGSSILTAASCVYSAADGLVGFNSIQFFNTLSGPLGSYASYTVTNIFIAPSFLIATPNLSPGDIAVITLSAPVQTSSNFGAVQPQVTATADAYVGQNLVVCGHGNIDNKGTKPGALGLQCTTLLAVPLAQCTALQKAPAAVTTGFICAHNNDDRDVCGGDNGSPVFLNSSTNGLQLVGVVSTYLDQRSNARCKDGHWVVATQVGAFFPFVTSPTAANSLVI